MLSNPFVNVVTPFHNTRSFLENGLKALQGKQTRTGNMFLSTAEKGDTGE